MSRAVRRRLAGGILLVLGGALVAGGVSWIRFERAVARPVDVPVPVLVEVPRGAVLAEVALSLQRAGVIEDARLFRLLAHVRVSAEAIRAGTYRFEGRSTTEEVLDTLVAGREALFALTVPEGLTLREMAAQVERQGYAPAEELLRAAADPAFLERLGIEGDSLEGRLFPETYHFRRGVAVEEILTAMHARFREVWEAELERHPLPEGWSADQALVLASIVEKETGRDEERPMVSSVFHNRLERGMRLQSDPTVIYGMAQFDGNLRREDLETDGPFNTYRRAGLPPGPICNPGQPSMAAALVPAQTAYLYFVARGDGSHEFSRSLVEHNRAVDRFQRGAP